MQRQHRDSDYSKAINFTARQRRTLVLLVLLLLGQPRASGLRANFSFRAGIFSREPSLSSQLRADLALNSVLRTASIEKVKSWAADDGLVLWTLANHGWRDFVFNWLATISQAKIKHFFVAALDARLLKELEERGVPCVSLHSSVGVDSIVWGTEVFKERGRDKIRFIHAMLKAGLQPMFSDLDVIWMRNPLPFVRQFKEANVLISTDSWNPRPGANHLDDCSQEMGASRKVSAHATFVGKMNVGIHLLRPSALPLVEAWLLEMLATGEMEQLCWNAVIMKDMLIATDGRQRRDNFCRAMGGRIVAGLLPASLFENGHTYFVQHLPHLLNAKPYAVHASYIPGSFNKIHHFREALQWHVDPPERFNGDLKLLTIDLTLPPELLKCAGPPRNLSQDLTLADAAGHLRLLQYQFTQIKAAALLARTLGRSLVMPQLWCGLENLWAPHRGRAWGGVDYPLPFQCPMSQLFHVEEWEKDSVQSHILPPMLESSYLQNPQAHIHHSDITNVTPCRGWEIGSGACCTGIGGRKEGCQAKLNSLSILPGLRAAEVLQILEGVEDARLLKVAQIHKLWLMNAADNTAEFSAAFDAVRRGWCCTETGDAVIVPISDAAIPKG